ncbi:methyltransferase, TIGR04325 family [Azospirillum thiophilum]|uniref:methyltransferase, TIGR04325 family n=1 Tax=Azospirillum thiophilum TaxID=528244 RepID=UPI000B0DA82B|nr:methyltransferase, TIGR04325 family [Azospirillum thiophilum]
MKIVSVRFEEHVSFEDAKNATSGYNDNLLIESMPNYKHSACINHGSSQDENTSNISGMAAFLSAASYYENNEFDVVDIGGSTGGHYALFKQLYRGSAKFRWHIVETSVQVNYGKKFIADPDLFFYEDISEINTGKINILHFGGVLGYLPDPIGYMDNPQVRKSDFIIFNRTSLVNGNSNKNFAQFVNYDKGVVSYAGRAFGMNLLHEIIERTHKVEINWTNHHEVFRLGSETLCIGSGMLCRRKGL